MKFIYPAISLDYSNPTRNSQFHYMLNAMKNNGADYEIAGYDNYYLKYLFGYRKLISKYIMNKNYFVSRDPDLIKISAKKINNQINKSDADFIFSFGTIPVAYLDTNKPIYIITDATFQNVLNYYPEYTNINYSFIKKSNELEKLAFQKAKRIFMSSHWAIKSAINDYSVPEHKLIQMPLGANIDSYPSQDEIQKIIEGRKNASLQLTLIGKDWYRKGGDIAIQIHKTILNKGVNNKLTIIGCKPPNEVLNDYIETIGFIDKTKNDGKKLFNQILSKTHFLLFPSRCETFGHVVCEANAFAIPVIANDTGGIRGAIDEGTNGFFFNFKEEKEIENAANLILKLYSDFVSYKNFASKAYELYNNKLNWDSIAKNVINIITQTINLSN